MTSKELKGLELLRKWLSEPEEKGIGPENVRDELTLSCYSYSLRPSVDVPTKPEQEETNCLRACLVVLRTLGVWKFADSDVDKS